MSYTKNTWVDRIATGDNKFKDQNNNNYTFTPTPDSVTQAGTPFSASWMNHIEDGIFGAWIKALLGQQIEMPADANLKALPEGAYFRYGLSSLTNLPPNLPHDVGAYLGQSCAWLYVGSDNGGAGHRFEILLLGDQAGSNNYIYAYICWRIQGGDSSPWKLLHYPYISDTFGLGLGWTANTAGKNTISRQGNRCVLTVSAKCSSAMSPSTAVTLTTLSQEYYPKYTSYGILYGYHSSTPTIDRVTIQTDGTVEIQGTTPANTSITGMVVYDSADS